MGIISTIAASLVLSMVVSDAKPDGATAEAFSNADTVAEKAVVAVASPLILVVDGTESAVNGIKAGGKAVGAGAVAVKDATPGAADSAAKSIKSGATKAKDATVAGAVYAGQKTAQGANYIVQKIGDGFGFVIEKTAEGLKKLD